MALIEMNFFSNSLKMNVSVNVILPNDSQEIENGYKTLYLLHGLAGNYTSWQRWTCIERYANEYKIAVVMPEVGRSWYTDTCYHANYFTFVTEELPDICRRYFRGMSAKREDNLIAGNSMGGYGAVKAALTYPDRYFACASLSGALDLANTGKERDMDEWRTIFGYQFKDQKELAGSRYDVRELLRSKKLEGVVFPKMYFWCGIQDGLIRANREYHALLNELEIEHCYEEAEGDHSWKYWDKYISVALEYLLKEVDKNVNN